MRPYNLIRHRRFLNNNIVIPDSDRGHSLSSRATTRDNKHFKAPCPPSRGHQSASVGTAGESTGPAPARLQRLHTSSDRPSPLSTKPSVSYVLFVTLFPKKALTTRRRHCSSYTYSTRKRLDDCKSFLRNKPNFQSNSLTLSVVIPGTYNANCPEKRKKNKPKTSKK